MSVTSWVLSCGGAADGVAVADDPSLDVSGVVATRALRRGDEILRIPLACLVVDALCERCTEEGRAIAQLASALHAPHIVQLAVFALFNGYEASRRGEPCDAYYAPFWRSMPSDAEMWNFPVLWPAAQLEWLRGSTAAHQVAKQRAEVREDYGRVCEVLPSMEAIPFDRFLLCHTLLGSRCFGVEVDLERVAQVQASWCAVHGGDGSAARSAPDDGSAARADAASTSESSSDEDGAAAEGSGRRRMTLARRQRRRRPDRVEEWTVLAPLADMLNHESGGGTVEWDLVDDAAAEARGALGDMTLRVVRGAKHPAVAVEPGAPVYTYYGDYSNSELLCQYGFATAAAPSSAVLSIAAEATAAETQRPFPITLSIDLAAPATDDAPSRAQSAAAAAESDGGALLRRRRALLRQRRRRAGAAAAASVIDIDARLSRRRAAHHMKRVLGILR